MGHVETYERPHFWGLSSIPGFLFYPIRWQIVHFLA
jgi:hypothetical protein